MKTDLVTRCPYCFGKMNVERLRCSRCHVAVEGGFQLSKLVRLSGEQQEFVEKFVLTGGSLKEMAEKMDISYPTVRNRLDRIIEVLSQTVDEEKERKRNVLDAVEEGRLSAEEASRLLKK